MTDSLQVANPGHLPCWPAHVPRNLHKMGSRRAKYGLLLNVSTALVYRLVYRLVQLLTVVVLVLDIVVRMRFNVGAVACH